jgi:cobalamin biosynthesis protein CbiM
VHVPDGYLSPATVGAGYALAVPFWGIAVHRAGKLIGGRTVPLLAIFSAFTFAVMMFNVPVPGGTTAHAVGGTLTAIVIGPWPAVISTSVALIIQALFFGDGGITAIGINCLNMGVILPLAGYVVYRVFAGRGSMLSQRRVIAAAIGSYVGITLAALAVGFELGIQPGLWSTNGVPDYSPYGLGAAIPAMLLSHIVGASFVEAVVTALGLAYLQRSYPEILLRRNSRAAELEEGGRGVNPWIPALGFTATAAAAVFVAGWIKGGSLGTWAGLDWSSVKGADVLATVLVSGIVSLAVLPVLSFALRSRRSWRAPMMIFVGILIWVPLGLIAPGGAFGEGASATPEAVAAALQAKQNGDHSLFDALPDVNRECSCVPTKMNNVDYASKTLLAGYQPPWVSASAPAWKQNAGYQAAGLAGMALLAVVVFGAYGAVRRLAPAGPPDWRTAEE